MRIYAAIGNTVVNRDSSCRSPSFSLSRVVYEHFARFETNAKCRHSSTHFAYRLKMSTHSNFEESFLSLPDVAFLNVLQCLGLPSSLELSSINHRFLSSLRPDREIWRVWLSSIFGEAFVYYVEQDDSSWSFKHRLMFEIGNTTPRQQVHSWILIARQRHREALDSMKNANSTQISS